MITLLILMINSTDHNQDTTFVEVLLESHLGLSGKVCWQQLLDQIPDKV